MDAVYDFTQLRYCFYGIQTSGAGTFLAEVQIPNKDKVQQQSQVKLETDCTDLKVKAGQVVLVVVCRTNNEVFIFRRTGPAGLKQIYQVKDSNKNRYPAGGDSLEIIGTSGPFIDQAYIFIGKNNNANIEFYEVLIDELASGPQELVFIHQDFMKKNLRSIKGFASGALNFGSDSSQTLLVYE